LIRLNKQKEFNVNLFNRDSAVDRSFADRTALVILLAAFGLSDAAAVRWSAGLVSGAEVFPGAFSFVLIAFGAIFTAYEMAHRKRRRLLGLAYSAFDPKNKERRSASVNHSSFS
jgi:hypothetical protein